MVVDVLLAGLQLPGTENHTLAALAHAGAQAGLDVRCTNFRGWNDVERIVDEVHRTSPKLFGISIQTTEAALVSLAMCRRLRNTNYAGRIVCGGHFSTLNAREVVASAAGVDAVVRFAGDRALPLLAKAYDEDEAALSRIPGLVYRDAHGEVREGAPADVEDAWFLSRSRVARELPLHLGFPAADLVSTHGCEHRCSYCCIAGSEQLARSEQRRAGLPAHERRRDPERELDALVDEIAQLFHQCDARVFNLMDDNVVPDGPKAAAIWAETASQQLRRRGVGKIALTLQVRADAIDESSARALATLGVVRAYLGIDGYSQARLQSLGRRADARAGRRAMAALSKCGVLCVANCLLIGPTLSFASVAEEIEGIAVIEHGPVHLLKIDLRAGTAYEHRARTQGLVEGSFLWPHYRFVDRRMERLAEAVVSISPRLVLRSVPIALYDLAYNLGIARRLLPTLDLDAAVRAYATISGAWNAEQVRFLRQAHAAVERDDAFGLEQVVSETLRQTELLDQPWLIELDGWVTRIERKVSAHRQCDVQAHTRGRLLGAVALSMSLAACGPGRVGASTTSTTMETSTTVGTHESSSESSSSLDDESTTESWGEKLDIGGSDLPPLPECADPRRMAFPESALFENGDGGSSPVFECVPCVVSVTFDENGVAVEFSYECEGTTGELDPEIKNAAHVRGYGDRRLRDNDRRQILPCSSSRTVLAPYLPRVRPSVRKSSVPNSVSASPNGNIAGMKPRAYSSAKQRSGMR
jgi:hypothetical protein